MMQRFLIPNQKMPNGQSGDDDISGDLARMIIGQGPAQNVGQGIGQLMAGLRNFATGGHNGGLF